MKVDGSGTFAIAHDGGEAVRRVSASGIITKVDSSQYATAWYLFPAAGNAYYFEDGYVLGYFDVYGVEHDLLTNQAGEVPGGVLVDGAGDIYYGGGYGITELSAAGTTVDLVDGTVCDMAFAPDGGIDFTGYAPSLDDGYSCTGVGHIDAAGNVTQLASGLPQGANGIAVDTAGDVLVSEVSGEVLKVGVTTSVVAGTNVEGFSGDGGPATSAKLNTPYGLNFDQSGDLLIADSANYRVRIVYGVGTGEAPPPENGPTYVPPIPIGQTYGGGATDNGDPSGSECACQAPLSRSSTPDDGKGDPVNTATGAFSYSATDTTLPGRGVTFSLARSYTSADATSGPFGVGWTMPYLASLTIPSGGATITFRSGDGAQAIFTQSGSAYTAPPGVRSQLSTAGSGYQVVNPDGTTMAFSATGQLTSVKDRHGEGVSLAYASGQLSTVTDAAGRVATFTFTGSTITKLTVPGATSGSTRTVTYGYTSGRLTTVQDMVGNIWTYGYDSAGRLNTIKSPRGNVLTTNTYNSAGRVTQQVDANNKTTTFGWTSGSNGGGTATTTDPDGGVWTDVYSGNVLLSTTDPDGRTTSYSYDAAGNRNMVTDPLGHVTTTSYDTTGDRLSQTDPLGRTESWTYNSLSEPLTAKDFDGNTTTNTYQSTGDLLSTTTPAGYESSWTYNTDGTIATAVNPLGNVSGATPSQYTTSYGYDAIGQLNAVTDPYGNKTTYTYDTAGRRASTVDPAGTSPAELQRPTPPPSRGPLMTCRM